MNEKTQNNMMEFLQTYQDCICRPGADKLLEYLKKSDFFTAPASTRFHLAEEGGLVEHSLNVHKRLRLLYSYQLCVSELTPEQKETIAIVGLLHDLCKIGCYKPEKKSRKTGNTLPNGKPEWEDYIGYAFDEELPYGHGEKSVYIISSFMKLTREEAMAIRWHMGFSDNDFKAGGYGVGNAFGKYPLSVCAHMADLWATYLDEGEA